MNNWDPYGFFWDELSPKYSKIWSQNTLRLSISPKGKTVANLCSRISYRFLSPSCASRNTAELYFPILSPVPLLLLLLLLLLQIALLPSEFCRVCYVSVCQPQIQSYTSVDSFVCRYRFGGNFRIFYCLFFFFLSILYQMKCGFSIWIFFSVGHSVFR